MEPSQAHNLEERINSSQATPCSKLVRALCTGILGVSLAVTSVIGIGCSSPPITQFSPDVYDVPEGQKYPITITPPETCLDMESSFGRALVFESGSRTYRRVRFWRQAHELPPGTYKIIFRCVYKKENFTVHNRCLNSLNKPASIAGHKNAVQVKNIQEKTCYGLTDNETIVLLSWKFSICEDGQVKAADKLVVEDE